MIEDTETIDEFLARHSADVEEALRKAAAAEILPRFRQLAAHEVDQKSGPHDLVTDADRNAELYLTAALGALLPGSVVVGEEAVHANPASYEAIQGDSAGLDRRPVDGTRQFVHGDPGFCILVALALARRPARLVDVRPGARPDGHRRPRTGRVPRRPCR